MKTGQYEEEDGWIAEVEILEDNSDKEWLRYKLRVIRTLQPPHLYTTPADGEIFSVDRRKGCAFGGMWHLIHVKDADNGGDVEAVEPAKGNKDES